MTDQNETAPAAPAAEAVEATRPVWGEAPMDSIGAVVSDPARAFNVIWRSQVVAAEFTVGLAHQLTTLTPEGEVRFVMEPDIVAWTAHPDALLAEAMRRAAHTPLETEWVVRSDDTNLLAVRSVSWPLVSPILDPARVVAAFASTVPHVPEGGFPVIFVTSAGECLVAPSWELGSIEAGIEAAQHLMKELPVPLSPLPYVFENGRVEAWQPANDHPLAQDVQAAGRWFQTLQVLYQKEFLDGEGKPWLEAEALNPVWGDRAKGGFSVDLRPSDFVGHAGVLVPLCAEVTLHPEENNEAPLTVSFQQFHRTGSEYVTAVDRMRPFLFRVDRFPDSYDFGDLKRAKLISELGNARGTS